MSEWYGTTATTGSGDGDMANRQDDEDEQRFRFVSRRSPVLCQHACVSTSQPLASSIGLDLLRKGANASDVAVAVAAAMAVLEPCSTGIGGDMFALYYDNASKQVACVNGSGRSPASLTLDLIRGVYNNASSNQDDAAAAAAAAAGKTPTSSSIDTAKFRDSPHSVTVPGAAQGWEDLLIRHGSGKFTMQQLLEPAIALAEDGFPVAPVTAHLWKAGYDQIRKWQTRHLSGNEDDNTKKQKSHHNMPWSVDGTNPPEAGDIIKNPDLARVLRDVGTRGAQKGFYDPACQTSQAIVAEIQHHGGCMTSEDLANHASTFPTPISTTYRDYQLWQIPPNGQGIAGLIALAGLGQLEQQDIIEPINPQTYGSADYYHTLIEMMRLGFADARAHVADPDHMTVDPATQLLDTDRIGKRAKKLFDAKKATIHGIPDASSCTISFQVVDCEGNAVSFVNSNYMGFGTGIVPAGCGFTLQNRGFGFTLEEGHPNCVAPNKRPLHTIIPAILTHAASGELYATLSNMGGQMQPQGHLQLTVGMLAGGLDPQTAIDMPRFCICDGTQSGIVFLEEGVKKEILDELKRRGHVMTSGLDGYQRTVFGRAQIIQRSPKNNVLWAGSDGRADGCAMGF